MSLSKLNLKGEGIFIKKISGKVLQEVKKDPGVRTHAYRDTAARIDELDLIRTIQRWARGGLDGAYLNELTEGLPFAKNTTYAVAYKYVYINNQADAVFVPVGFITYGTYNPNRSTGGEKYEQRIDTVHHDNATQGKVAEIEGVITKPVDGERTEGRGVGRSLVEYATADLLNRKKTGAARFSHIVMFTAENAIDSMNNAIQGYGYGVKDYTYWQKNDNGNGMVNQTRYIVDNYDVDDPSTAKSFVLRVNRNNLRIISNYAENRIVKTNVCPPKRDDNRQWQVCL